MDETRIHAVIVFDHAMIREAYEDPSEERDATWDEWLKGWIDGCLTDIRMDTCHRLEVVDGP